MNIQTETQIVYIVRLTDQDIAEALTDPTELQNALRAARGQHAVESAPPHPYRNTVRAQDIARAAEKQNEKIKKRFLAAPGTTFACPDCEKTFVKQRFLSIHRGKMHKSLSAQSNPPNGKTVAVHAGNTFPLSVQDAD